jgi:hypothetical protein
MVFGQLLVFHCGFYMTSHFSSQSLHHEKPMDWGFMKIQDFVSSRLMAPYFHKVPPHILMQLQLSNEK